MIWEKRWNIPGPRIYHKVILLSVGSWIVYQILN